MTRGSRRLSRSAVLVTTLIAVVACSAKTSARSTPTSASDHTVTSPAVGAATTTAALAPQARAEAILGAADQLLSSFVPDSDAPTPVMRQDPDPCRPVSSAAWLAALNSPTYASSDTTIADDIQAQVDIMPSDASARAMFAKVADPTFGTRCRLSSNDDTTLDVVDASPSSCGLSFVGSKISNIPSSALANGAVGTRYVARVHCDATNVTSSVYHDQIAELVGSTYISLSFTTNPSPPDRALEIRMLDALASRARANT